MTTPKTSKPESKDEKKKSPEAERAVVKPKAKKEQDEKADSWITLARGCDNDP